VHVTADVSIAHVTEELSRVEPWVQLHGWKLDWNPSTLHLAFKMRSKVDDEIYIADFSLDAYRALPPFIEFCHPTTGERGTRRCYPAGGRGYFHNHPVICAPWNRKAYAAHGGPHGDWVMASWATQRPHHSQLGDILVLLQELVDDRNGYAGRMER
jgi:hypothetical protein